MKQDKKWTLCFLICLIFFIKSMLYLVMGADFALNNPVLKPFLCFFMAIWNLLLCIGLLILSYILSNDDILCVLKVRKFRISEIAIAIGFGSVILSVALMVNSVLVCIYGASVIISGVVFFFILRKLGSKEGDKKTGGGE